MLVIMIGELMSICEWCYERRCCFLMMLNVDDDYDDDSLLNITC